MTSRLAHALSAALLATLLSALIVVADRLVDAFTGGGLMLALLVLWLVLFAGLALFQHSAARLAFLIAREFQGGIDPAHTLDLTTDIEQADARARGDVNAALAHEETGNAPPTMVAPVFYRPW